MAGSAVLKRLRLGRSALLPEMDETQLLVTLESAEWQVRMAAVQKLEEYGERAPIESFIRALKDEHEAVRAAAAHALGTIGNPKAIIPLIDALQDVTWLVRSAVIQALGRFGEQAPIEPFTVALHDEDESVRTVAVSALGTKGERVPIELLLTALQDSAWQVREMALLALGVRGEHIPQATLKASLQDEDESVHRTVHFLQEMYPDHFAETIEGIPASVSEENSGNALNEQLQILRPAASGAEQQETYNGNTVASPDSGQFPLLFQATYELEQAGRREEGSGNLPRLDDEQGQQSAVPYRNPQHYPRRGTMRALRLALLFCWSIFLGYLVSVIWNLIQLTHVDLAQLTAQVAIQALLAPLTGLTELNVPVWVGAGCMLLVLLLFIGCLWAARDTWYEHMWVRRQGVRGEELEVESEDHDEITRARVKPPREIPATRQLSRRAVLVGFTTVFIVGNSIAWSLLFNSKRRQGSSGRSLGTVFYIDRRHTGSVRAAAWSPDSTRIASASDDKMVHVWDAANGGHSFTYSGHSSAVRTVAWSPDGRRIASAGDDGTVQVWDASTGKNVCTNFLGHVHNFQGSAPVAVVAWSPHSTRIASGSGKTVQVWGAM